MSKKRRVEPAPVVHHAHDSAEVLQMERLLLFTDAVFAIIMTLLALDVRHPEGADLYSAQGIVDAFARSTGKFAAYALSFIVIAMMWNTHLRRYRYLTAVDGKIIAGTVLQLLLTGLIPFATSMIAQTTQIQLSTALVGNLNARIRIESTGKRPDHHDGPQAND